MKTEEVYQLVRETFHSQSGLFLNKEQSMAVAIAIKYISNGEDHSPLKTLADNVISWQKMFNKAQEELEQIDGKKRLRGRVSDRLELINNALGLNKDNDEED